MIREWVRFLGKKGSLFLLAGVLIGASTFGAELAFAYLFGAFLAALGVADGSALRLPGGLASLGLIEILWVMVGFGALRAALSGVHTYLQMGAPEHFKHLQRQRMVRWVFSARGPDTHTVTSFCGELVNQAASAVMRLQGFLSQLTVTLFLTVSLIWMAPVMTLAVWAALMVLVLPMGLLSRKFKEAGKGLGEEWDKANSRLVRSVRNLLLLRIYGMHLRERDQVQGGLNAYFAHALTNARMNGLLSALPQLAAVLVVCLIAFLGKTVLQLSPGVLLPYCYLFIRFAQNVVNLNVAFSSLLYHLPQLQEVARWWKLNEDASYEKGEVSAGSESRLEAISSPMGWRVRGLEFRYGHAGSRVFRGLDLEIPPGQCLVIVGPSGVGKTTLLHLLLGELEPRGGRIEVGWEGRWQSLTELKSRLLRNIGYVGPDSFHFDGTIREHLLYGLEKTPSEEEIERTLRMAECRFVHDLPDGLSHRMSEQGLGLSAGQKQRLSLVRALLRRPRALILDEATANLDAETASSLVDTFEKLKGHTTLIAATHRPELLRIADIRLDLGTAEGASGPLSAQGRKYASGPV